MNKTIIGITTGILILGGLVWISRPDATSIDISSAAGNGSLAVEENGSYNFGSISMAAGNVKHEFIVKNTSGEPIVINKIYTSCMCTTASLFLEGVVSGPFGMPGHGAIPRIDKALAVGEEATVEVVFDPAAHGPAGIGRIQRTVSLEHSAGKPVQLQFEATVTP